MWRHPAPYSRRSKVERGATAASTGSWLGLRGTAARACVRLRRQEPGAGSPVGQRCSRRGARRVAWGTFGRLPLEKGPALPAPPRCPLPAALVVFTTTTSPQLPPSPLPPPHVECGVSPAVLSRCDAGSGCRTSPLTLPSSPNSAVESPPPNRENYYFCTVLLVLHRTLYGRVSVIFPVRVAGIHPHYNGIPQRGASVSCRVNCSSRRVM